MTRLVISCAVAAGATSSANTSSAPVIWAVAATNPGLALFCPPGSEQELAAREAGLALVREVFLDRGYTSEGTLVVR